MDNSCFRACILLIRIGAAWIGDVSHLFLVSYSQWVKFVLLLSFVWKWKTKKINQKRPFFATKLAKSPIFRLGPYLNDVYKIFWIFTPSPSPHICICLIFLSPPHLQTSYLASPPPLSGTSSPAYSTSRLLGKEGKPG